MVELLVMRHAKSAWDTGATDFDRPLNARGRSAAALMADWIAAAGLCPDRIVSSAAVRARSTVEPIVASCRLPTSAVELKSTLYLADADDWLVELRAQNAARVLICGHNPGLDDVVVDLLGRTPVLTPSGKLMTTAAIAHLSLPGDWAGLDWGSATLVTLERPRRR